MSKAVIVREWDPEAFHRRVLELEEQGYATRRETYRVIPEMNPETGKILHLYTVEMGQADPDETSSSAQEGSGP